jgi:hypothetical protein
MKKNQFEMSLLRVKQMVKDVKMWNGIPLEQVMSE